MITSNAGPAPDAMMDPRGNYYKKDAKLGPYVYFKTLQNIPVNLLNVSQVLPGGGEKQDGYEDAVYDNKIRKFIKDGKICEVLDVHEAIKEHPELLYAIQDSLKYPAKYLKKDNLEIWLDYVWKMV